MAKHLGNSFCHGVRIAVADEENASGACKQVCDRCYVFRWIVHQELAQVLLFLADSIAKRAGRIFRGKDLWFVSSVNLRFHLLTDILQKFWITVITKSLREADYCRRVDPDGVGKLCCRHEGDFIVVTHDIVRDFPVTTAEMVVVLADLFPIHLAPLNVWNV